MVIVLECGGNNKQEQIARKVANDMRYKILKSWNGEKADGVFISNNIDPALMFKADKALYLHGADHSILTGKYAGIIHVDINCERAVDRVRYFLEDLLD